MNRLQRSGSLKILESQSLHSSIAVVVGTRPGIIKFSPLLRALERLHADFCVIHTGQHYSYNMDRLFFRDLSLPRPQYVIPGTRRHSYHGAQTAEMLVGIEKCLLKERPRVVVVGGDANTNLAGALAGRKLGLVVVHLEAGLRSFDWRMPEEHNRVMIDHISDYLLAPNRTAKENLQRESVRGKIRITGTTIVDAVVENLGIAEKKYSFLRELGLKKAGYVLATVHREENVDSRTNLAHLTKGLIGVGRATGLPVVFPVHPRTLLRLKTFSLDKQLRDGRRVRLIQPVGYMKFLQLMGNAALVLTDSGGVQQEACILQTPCVTLRENTEWTETVEVGANRVAGTCPKEVVRVAKKMVADKRQWPNPFGTAGAAGRAAKILLALTRAQWPE